MQSIRSFAILAPFAAFGLLAACLPGGGGPAAKPMPTGQQDFAQYCAGCHGANATGDGPMAGELPHRPANLTVLAKNNGGTFPTTRVMAKIWGYSGGGQNGAVMPEFAPLLENATLVLYDGGDGIQTPTPLRLVQMAEYIKSIQVN